MKRIANVLVVYPRLIDPNPVLTINRYYSPYHSASLAFPPFSQEFSCRYYALHTTEHHTYPLQSLESDKLDIDNPKKDFRGQPQPYYLNQRNLDLINSALEASRADIPSHLGHAPRSIGKHYNGYKAAEWKAWLLYYGLPLLDQNLNEESVDNFRVLSQFYALCTKHTLSADDIPLIKQLAINFVQGYERIYYGGDIDRLPVCTINIHSLLHFSDYVLDCGPACYWWQFPMERYCGVIKPRARSKSQLSSSVSNAVLIIEHLNHLRFTPTGRSIKPEADTESEEFPRLLDGFRMALARHQRESLFHFIGQQVRPHPSTSIIGLLNRCIQSVPLSGAC